MGESKLKRLNREEMLLSCAEVQTMAGRLQVRWATESAATPTRQLAYFIGFINLTGLWLRWPIVGHRISHGDDIDELTLAVGEGTQVSTLSLFLPQASKPEVDQVLDRVITGH